MEINSKLYEHLLDIDVMKDSPDHKYDHDSGTVYLNEIHSFENGTTFARYLAYLTNVRTSINPNRKITN
jgi:hypothetical protein